MEQKNLNEFSEPKEQPKIEKSLFDKFFRETVFTDKKVLQSVYVPEVVKHREKQIDMLASILAPIIRRDKPSNVFCYGKTGTGKTLSVLYVTKELHNAAKSSGIPAKFVYLNCKLRKIADTEYRLVAQLSREMGVELPATGLPTSEVYEAFTKKIDSEEQIVVLILDEIDQIVNRIGDEILYNLTRLNAEFKKAQLTLIGISNDVRFMENIDARVRSSLGEEEIVFPPYNALELKEILESRAKLAFKQDVVEEGVLAKCAAYAAREHGDARRALDLLRVAGEIAERDGESKVEDKHIDLAEEKIEKSRVVEIVETQPKQSQAVLFSVLFLLDSKKLVETGEVFDKYKEVCKQSRLVPLTQRRVSDLISELDMLGIINAKVISKGRYGRTREIYISIPSSVLDKIKEILSGVLV